MHEDMIELEQRLRTLAGTIMEDASAGAILIDQASATPLSQLRVAAEDVLALLAAAQVVHRRA